MYYSKIIFKCPTNHLNSQVEESDAPPIMQPTELTHLAVQTNKPTAQSD
jgi:hypothetical protein